MSENFTSSASNFINTSSGNVDPRTGMYNYSFSVATLAGNAGLGPNLNVAVSYSPLTTTNTGFGTGFSLPVTRYDKSTQTLQLSTGESYKVNEVDNKLNVLYSKNIHFRTEVKNDGYYIYYNDGTVERLTAPGKGGDIKVAEIIMSPSKRVMTLKWENFGNGKRLLAVSDEYAKNDIPNLLKVNYTAAGVTFDVWPDSKEHYAIKLKMLNNFVISVTNSSITPALVWALEYNNKKLISVVSPEGMKERVTYNQNGHKFPLGSPNPPLPYVTRYWQTGKDGALISDRRYVFSDKNFLGFGGNGGSTWNNDTDFLYGMASDYQYSSTETIVDENESSLKRIQRTYSNYHLQTREESTLPGSGCTSVSETKYYSVRGLPFEKQPVQFQFPKKVTATFTDNSLALNERTRTEITLTEFDDFGNLIKEQTPDGVITEYTYYPANGEEGNCPSDPNGFVRFLKKKTIKPRVSEYNDTPPEVTTYQYGNLGDSDCVVLTESKTYSGTQLLSTDIINYESEINSLEFGRIVETINILHNEHGNFESKKIIKTTASDGVMTQIETTIGHDKLTITSKRTESIYSSLLLSETDIQGITIKYTYDKLGRLITKTNALDTNYECTTYWHHEIKENGFAIIQTDPSGQCVKQLFDSAGRETYSFTKDSDGEFYLTNTIKYNLLGDVSNEEKYDWLSHSNKAEMFSLKSISAYDDWGNNYKSEFSDLTNYYKKLDPVSMTITEYTQGKKRSSFGRKITTLDKISQLPITDTFVDKEGKTQGKRHYIWDGLGLLRKETDERGNSIKKTYDVWGRVLSETFADGSILNRKYAPHLTGDYVTEMNLTGPDKLTETYLLGRQEFDSLGRLISSTSGGRTTTYTYEGAAPVPAVVTQPSGKTLHYTYIAELNYVVSEMISDDVTQIFTYDSKTAKTLTEKEGTVCNTNQWTPSGYLKGEVFTRDGHADTTEYTWSLNGDIATYTDISGKKTSYGRDNHGRLVTIMNDSLTANLQYNDHGQLDIQKVTNNMTGSELTTKFEFDDFGRETCRIISDNNGMKLALLQKLMLNGLLESRTTQLNDIAVREEVFSYDVRNRLVDFAVSGRDLPSDSYGNKLVEQHYHYDVLNNLKVVITTLADGSENTATYSYNNADDPMQLTSITNTHNSYPATIFLKYDSNGRMYADESHRILSYDAVGRLRSISKDNVILCNYTYDAQNKLISQDINNKEIQQLYYCGNELVNESLTKQQTISLIKQGHTCIGICDGSDLSLIASDQNDSPLWSDTSKEIEGKQHIWSPYGSGNTDDLLYAYNGERPDPVSGMYHLGNGYRTYSPVLMRFNSPDNMSPFGEGGINTYTYCQGDPINFTDPSGHSSLGHRIWAGIGLVFGTLGSIMSLSACVVSCCIKADYPRRKSTGAFASVTSAISLISGAIAYLSKGNETTERNSTWVSLAFGLVSAPSGFFFLGKKRQERHDSQDWEAPMGFWDRIRNQGQSRHSQSRRRPSISFNRRSNRSSRSSRSSTSSTSSTSSNSRAETNIPLESMQSAEQGAESFKSLSAAELIDRIINNPDNSNNIIPKTISHSDWRDLRLKIHPDKNMRDSRLEGNANKAFQTVMRWKAERIFTISYPSTSFA